MSSANVNLVRSIFATWESGDYSQATWAHPESEYVFADGPLPGRWTGPEGLTEGWRDRLSAWKDLRVESEEFRELDRPRVLVLFHFSGRGKTSGVALADIKAQGATIFHVRGNRVVRIVTYWDRERALADLSITPKADSP